MFQYKRLFLIPVDIALVALSYVLAYLIRFEGEILASKSAEIFWPGLLITILVKPTVFFFSGFYRRLWRYASIPDLIHIVKAVFIGSFCSFFITLVFTHFQGYSRSVFVLDWFFVNAFIMGRSLLWRVLQDLQFRQRHRKGQPTLIVGAGMAGRMLFQEIRGNERLGFHVVGFLDDDSTKLGASISGVPVLGRLESLQGVVKRNGIEKVILAIPSAPAPLLRDVVQKCRDLELQVQTLPSMGEMLSQDHLSAQIRDVDVEDLLGRDPVRLDVSRISAYLQGKRILITGAGGSIGSEICRQVARFEPMRIILYENAETPLFRIEKELAGRFPHIKVVPIVGDVRSRSRVEAIFDEFMPEVVFHAAAYKHVPMMEHNPAEAAHNNVQGTRIVADAADAFGVQHFVMISTDKAVNPTNIMGATKRAAELYVQALARRSKTNFVTVRFGNVLGSNGSVIPTFKEQIRAGGPVTVTHPEVTRFFMTIPEATQLVLQAGSMGRGGEIFLLDMGDPVKITTLAEELIRLSGLEPYEDIDIVFTGLRPGEKLYEELLLDGEGVLPTGHEKICVAKSAVADEERLLVQLDALFSAARDMDLQQVRSLLQEIVPEYQPARHGTDSKIIRHPALERADRGKYRIENAK